MIGLLWWVVKIGLIAFVLYYVFSSPTEAAHFVTGVFHGIEGFAQSLKTFVNSL